MIPIFISSLLTCGFLLVSSVFASSRMLLINSIGVRSGAMSDFANRYQKLTNPVEKFLTSHSIAPWGSDEKVT